VAANKSDSLPSYPLRNYRLAWAITNGEDSLLARGEEELGDLGEPRSISPGLHLQSTASSLKLRLMLLRPTGEIAAEQTVEWNAGLAGTQPAPGAAAKAN